MPQIQQQTSFQLDDEDVVILCPNKYQQSKLFEE